MAINVLKRGIIPFLALSFQLNVGTCALLNRDNNEAEAQCSSDAILESFRAHSNALSFCSAYLAGEPAGGADISVRHRWTRELEAKNCTKFVANETKTTTVIVADTTLTTEETVSPTMYVTSH